jgi:4-amino-4-deoxy-L-arabinose transferase-like glycosyltransferase
MKMQEARLKVFLASLGVSVATAALMLAPSWNDLPRARLGPILLFSFTAGAICTFVAGRWGGWAAALAASSWVFQPNLFAHGHDAGFDATLTALWVLAIVAFAQAMEPAGAPRDPGATRWGWTLGFGLVVSCAMANKLTGWFLPLPFLVWAASHRSRRAFRTLRVGRLVAAAVVYAMVPPWWPDPLDGVSRFLAPNLTRSVTFPLRIQFLHVDYETPRESLPWYNTLVWTVPVTPVGFLVMAGAGFWSALCGWRREPIGLHIAHVGQRQRQAGDGDDQRPQAILEARPHDFATAAGYAPQLVRF